MDEKIKTWTLRFPAKENPNMEKALFDWPIVLQYDVKVKYRLISRKFSGMKFFQPSVRWTDQKPLVRMFSFQGHTKIDNVKLLSKPCLGENFKVSVPWEAKLLCSRRRKKP